MKICTSNLFHILFWKTLINKVKITPIVMPRFSAKAIEIQKEIWDSVDLSKVNSRIGELNHPLDIAYVKLSIVFQNLVYRQQDKFLEELVEFENENKGLDDEIIEFMINVFYCTYYIGNNVPRFSKEKAEKYLNIVEQSYQDIDYKDDWEKYQCGGLYYWTKATYVALIANDWLKAIKFQKRGIKSWAKIPDSENYYSLRGYNNLGRYYFWVGDFEEAEKCYIRCYEGYKKFNSESISRIQLMILANLSQLHFIKGNIQKAKDLLGQFLDLTKRSNNNWGIAGGLSIKGKYLFEEGRYDKAIKTYEDSLSYRIKHNDPLYIFWGYYNIFEIYYQRYKITNDREFLKMVDHTFANIQELSKKHSNNKTIINYTNYVHSLILKHGNVRKRAEALDTLEELIEIYPDDIGISLNLLELLFEDVLQSEDQDTIVAIDKLMLKISKIPLRNNSQALLAYISQQIFMAKYHYFIKGDLTLALNILHDARDHINSYKLDNLENEIDAEIQLLEKEVTKWDDLDISVKDRIKQSEFTKYILQAQQIMDQQTSTG